MTWAEIACVLMQRLAPQGVVLSRHDLSALPQDRVLVDDRSDDGTEISFYWVSVAQAQRLRPKVLATGHKAWVSELQGRWQKFVVVLLWKLARDGIDIGLMDARALPHDKTLMMRGYKDALDCRFVPRTEAQRMAHWHDEHEPQDLVKEFVQ